MDTSLPISQLDPLGANVFTGLGDLYGAYLGPLPTLQRSDPYEKRNVSVWDMPENYKGKNYYLRDTVEDLLFTANQTYLSTYVLPLFPTDDINMAWEQLEYNAHLMELTPYRTTSHAVTSKRSVRKAQLVRWGIQAEFENDFLGTPMGRAHFLATLGQIARSLMETLNAEILRACVTGHRYQQQFLRDAGMQQDIQLKYVLEQDKERFAIVQKTKNGLEKLDMMISSEMSKYRGEADCFLIPEEISIYATIVPPEKTDYYLAGSLGPARVNNLDEGRALAKAGTTGSLDRVEPLHLVRNTPVFIVKNLQVENVTEAESMLLTRVRQIGEYVTMIDECEDYSNYRTEHRSILMYDQEADDMRKITLEHAIENCGLFAENGEIRPLDYDGRDSVSRRQDQDEDFLTFLRPGEDGTTVRTAVEYLFDIAPEFLDARKVVNGGQSLYHAMIRQYGQTATAALERIQRQSMEVLQPAWDNLSDQLRTDFALIQRFLVQIIGVNSFLNRFLIQRREQEAELDLNEPGVLFFMVFVVLDRDPVARRGLVQEMQSRVSSDVDNAFFQALLSQVPTSKKSEIKAVIDSQGSALEKGSQIRDKILGYVGENVSGLKFKDEAPVHAWYETRVNQYKELSQQKTSSSATSVSGQIVGYMPRGSDLSGTEYQFVHDISSRPISSHVEGIFPLRMQTYQDESPAASVDSRMRYGGEGLGLAGIGQFAHDPRENQGVRRRRNTLARFSTLNAQLEQLNNSGANEVDKVFARAYLMMQVTRQNLLSLARNHVMIPLNFLLFRPHMQYRTRAIVKCKQNGGTGITGIGHSDMSIESTGDTKVSRMHYTTHFRSIIRYPKNLYVQPDVYVQSAEGGAGCRFYSPDTYRTLDLENLDASLICVAVPITETHFPSPLDISGRFYTEFNQGLSARAQFERLHYSTAARYNQLYGWLHSQNQGSEVPHLAPGYSHRNRICYQGHQQNYNPKTNDYNKIIVNKGHWTKNVYAGCAEIRNGKLEVLEKMNYATKNSN